MKNKEEIFKLLRESVEDEREAKIVEDLVNKIELKMLPIEVVDEKHVKFSGVTYCKDADDNRYYVKTSLTRNIWHYYYGEIPNGFEVHHKDFNKDNNDISNFQLLTKAEHTILHFEKRLKIFKCKVCGKEFEGVSFFNNNCYCSDKCREIGIKNQAWRKNLITYTCEYCGREFKALKYHNYKFCSQECINKSKERHEIKNCAFCGKKFEARVRDKRQFCSADCALKARHTPENYEDRVCKFCGKIFKAHKLYTRKYCSDNCARKAQRRKNNK